MAEIQWYYARGGEQMGPVSPTGLKQIAQSGEIAAGDLVWREGMAEWAPAGTVKGLFPDAVADAPARGAPAAEQVQTETPAVTPTGADYARLAFSPPSTTPPAAATIAPSTIAQPVPTARSTAPFVGSASQYVQLVLWILCAVIVIIAACQFTVAALRAENPSDRAAAAGVFSAYFIGAYVVARAGERLCSLVEQWGKR